MNGPKIYWTLPLGITITQTTVASFVVMVLLCTAAVVLGRNLEKRPGRRQVLVEKGVTMLYDMVGDTMGKHNLYRAVYGGAVFVLGMRVFYRYDGYFPLCHGRPFHHGNVGNHDEPAVLGLLHQAQRRRGLAQGLYRTCGGHDADEFGF